MRSTKEGAIAAFEKLIKKDKVIAILGPTLSNSAKAADPIAQESKVVVLATSNTVAGVVEIGNFIFRDSLPESAVQPNTVKVTQDKLGYKKVAVCTAMTTPTPREATTSSSRSWRNGAFKS